MAEKGRTPPFKIPWMTADPARPAWPFHHINIKIVCKEENLSKNASNLVVIFVHFPLVPLITEPIRLHFAYSKNGIEFSRHVLLNQKSRTITGRPVSQHEYIITTLRPRDPQFPMEPSAVIPNYDQTFPLKDDSQGSRPSNLTLSSITSSKAHSPEPSPTKSRFRENGDMANDMMTGIVKGPFMYVGPEKKRFHAKRSEAPYPLPCGLDELSR